MGDIFGLEGNAFVCQGSKFEEDAFGLADSLRQAIECQLLTARREPHTQFVFDQLEMTVVITEQDGSIGAFS
jgi:hypothetical protein